MTWIDLRNTINAMTAEQARTDVVVEVVDEAGEAMLLAYCMAFADGVDPLDEGRPYLELAS